MMFSPSAGEPPARPTRTQREQGAAAPYACIAVGAMRAAGAGGAFAAGFRPAGMARAMAGVAIMQALLGSLIATAPSTADLPGGPSRALLFCGAFAMLWLLSAPFFRFAAKADREATAH